jgi:hypothetical protein
MGTFSRLNPGGAFMPITHYVPDLARLREALMARLNLTLADYGIDLEPAAYVDELAELMANLYPAFSVDELLVRPREALRYCDAARQRFQCYDLPDDLILRPLLSRREQP